MISGDPVVYGDSLFYDGGPASRGLVNFHKTTFSDSWVSFSAAFSGGTVDFHDVTGPRASAQKRRASAAVPSQVQ
ncbi:hypothetical protein OG713_41810 [Streptomyces sp. NBC_00723]|uniref:hypothetical protein n=1 Tax=Streptomyces sp. NBC_00723 TaxID=2903673 RepID=UPI003864AF18